MIYEARCFWHPKDIGYEKDYEDAFTVGEHGVVAIADGVSSAIFSRRWAEILTRRVVEGRPDLSDAEQLTGWLAESRKAWAESVNLPSLTYFQRSKLQDVGGAYSTLLWVELFPEPTDDGTETVQFRFASHACGDCCLFHVRVGEVLEKFPLQNSADFKRDPISICSTNRGADAKLEFQSLEGACQSGDLIILASDAIAGWVYHQIEVEEPIDWDAFWGMTAASWTQTVRRLRGQEGDDRMRVDDTTLVMLRMATRTELDAEPDAEEPFSPLVISSDLDACTVDEDAESLEELVETVSPLDDADVPADPQSDACMLESDVESPELADSSGDDSPPNDDAQADEQADSGAILTEQPFAEETEDSPEVDEQVVRPEFVDEESSDSNLFD